MAHIKEMTRKVEEVDTPEYIRELETRAGLANEVLPKNSKDTKPRG